MADPTSRPISPADDTLAAGLEWGDQRDGPEPGGPGPRSNGAARAPRPAPDAIAEPATVEVVSSPTGEAALGRFVVDAYDRLADRVLERLRQIRVDVDADLGAVRSELATLRQAVDDVADRVQLRQLRASVDELRGDVAGLRRAVLEWPELAQVSSELAGLRADVSDLLGRPAPEPPAAPLELPAELSSQLAALRAEVAALARRPEPRPAPAEVPAAVLDALAALRQDQARLHDALAQVAGAVSAPPPPPPPPPGPDLEPVLATLVDDVATLRAEVRAAAARPATTEVRGLGPLVQEIGAVRADLADVGEQMTALKRRVGLRAKAAAMDDGDLERLATLVADRLASPTDDRR